MRRWVSVVFCALLLGVFVASCTTVDDEALIACPNVSVVKSLGELVKFKLGPGRDPTDVDTEAWIDRVGGGCVYEDQTFLVDLSVEMSVRRGPANKTAVSDINLIVAILDANDTVLQRQLFRTKVPFRSFKTAKFTESIELQIPVSKGVSGGSFTVFVGYELSPEELKENRRKYGRAK
jgi:hypothetical protein